jgi:hypothetical protein
VCKTAHENACDQLIREMWHKYSPPYLYQIAKEFKGNSGLVIEQRIIDTKAGKQLS